MGLRSQKRSQKEVKCDARHIMGFGSTLLTLARSHELSELLYKPRPVNDSEGRHVMLRRFAAVEAAYQDTRYHS